MGVVDDVAVLSETDIKNKDKIIKRKSLYSQMKSQLDSMKKQVQDKEGTIETLERQLVQAGIKGKVMQGQMEVSRKTAEAKALQDMEAKETKMFQQKIREDNKKQAESQQERMTEILNNLPNSNKGE